jgi:hypothetical protein
VANPAPPGAFAWAHKSAVIALAGQSNISGFATGATSSLPATDPIDGHTLVRDKPAGVSFYEDGAAVAAWTNPFGLEVGIASVLDEAILLKRGENGTAIASWTGGAGHMVSCVSDWATAGHRPSVLVWLQGEADADEDTGTLAAGYPTQIARLKEVMASAMGAGMGLLAVRIPVTHTDYSFAETVRGHTEDFCERARRLGYNAAYFDPTVLPWYGAVSPLQADLVHLNGLGMYRLGRAIGQYLQSEGYG